jgi:hypothetical protein
MPLLLSYPSSFRAHRLWTQTGLANGSGVMIKISLLSVSRWFFCAFVQVKVASQAALLVSAHMLQNEMLDSKYQTLAPLLFRFRHRGKNPVFGYFFCQKKKKGKVFSKW